jgi:cytochrome oxidase Cu insertion factor (SCO1/SenC/PrrC family)
VKKSVSEKGGVTILKKAVGLAIALFAFSVLLSAQSKNLEALKGKTVPDFQLRDLDGKVYRFSQFRGKVLLLNFWSPY